MTKGIIGLCAAVVICSASVQGGARALTSAEAGESVRIELVVEFSNPMESIDHDRSITQTHEED